MLVPGPRLLAAAGDAPAGGWSGIAAELGLKATVGVGSVAMRVTSCSHCDALSSPTIATGMAGAVRPTPAAWAAMVLVVAVDFEPTARTGAGVNTISI